MNQSLHPSQVRTYRMLHRIVCHLDFDQQKDWTVGIGPCDYTYANVESKV